MSLAVSDTPGTPHRWSKMNCPLAFCSSSFLLLAVQALADTDLRTGTTLADILLSWHSPDEVGLLPLNALAVVMKTVALAAA